MDFFDENYDENENYFANEFKARERTNYVGKLQEMLNQHLTFDNKRKNILSADERFLIAVDTFARKIDIFKLSNIDIDFMLEKTLNIKNIKYKNPTAYVLGYIISDGGNKINKNKFKQVVDKILPEFKDFGVEPEDVLRYGRFWLKLL